MLSKIIFLLTTCVMSIAFQSAAYADRFGRACNETNETVWMAVGFLRDLDCPGKAYCPNTWASEGWWSIAPNTCSWLDTHTSIANNRFSYFHAFSTRYEWTGDGTSLFCIGGDPFMIYQNPSSSVCSETYSLASFVQTAAQPSSRFRITFESNGGLSWNSNYPQ